MAEERLPVTIWEELEQLAIPVHVKDVKPKLVGKENETVLDVDRATGLLNLRVQVEVAEMRLEDEVKEIEVKFAARMMGTKLVFS